MRAGVGNRLGHVVVRQIRVARGVAKRKLQNAHARKVVGQAQVGDFLRDEPQVFCDQRQWPKRIAQGIKQAFSGARFPLPNDGVRLLCGNFPIGLKTAKVVQTQNIHTTELVRQAALPPSVAIGLHGRPVIQRVAPALTSGAEVVGWHTRDHTGMACLIEQVLTRIGPDICRMMCYKNRSVTNNKYAGSPRICS